MPVYEATQVRRTVAVEQALESPFFTSSRGPTSYEPYTTEPTKHTTKNPELILLLLTMSLATTSRRWSTH